MVLKNNKKINKTILILFIIFSSNLFFLGIYNVINNDGDQGSEKVFNKETESRNPSLDPKASNFGDAKWWNNSFEYRQLINITNPYAYNFTDYGTSVSFNYGDLVQAGKMQSDLDDVRIVENGELRALYVSKDYPSQDIATVWFDTNISKGPATTETDIYMYFGNNSVSSNAATDSSKSFGWVKNGDFELDISSESKFNPFGWTFTHEPVDFIMGEQNPYDSASNSSDTSYQYFINKLISNPQGGERIGHGSYSYKWGALNSILPDGTVNDYAGTFFSYPFKVPKVEGGEISLKIYRNVRTYHFERPKNVGTINHDGYFIRVLNGSDYDANPDNHDDANINAPNYENYAEAKDGNAYYNNPAKKWQDSTTLMDLATHSNIVDTLSDSDIDGDLTGYIELNLTRYMGQEIFFEMGVWGEESNTDKQEKSGFFQVDDVGFNYTLDTVMNEIQARKSDIAIIARDVDGRIVPNAKITLYQNTNKIDSALTSQYNGSVTFTGILNGNYNITANYTINGRNRRVFDSGNEGISYFLNGKDYELQIQLDLWTIDFEIFDWENEPLTKGYLNIYNDESKVELIQTLTLDSQGTVTFRWLNQSKYYFEVFYDDADYYEKPLLLNESYIYRKDYIDASKFQSHTFFVNQTNQAPSGENRYEIKERIYSNGTGAKFNFKKIIQADISLNNMEDKLTNISIYYIDENNSTGEGTENLIYFEEDYGLNEDSDNISLDIPLIDNEKLKMEKFEVYGLFIEVYGENNTICNGEIRIDLIEGAIVYNKTHLTKLDVRVVNFNELGQKTAVDSAIIKITDMTGQSIVNLTSDSSQDGYAFDESGDRFWYLRGYEYNFSIDVVDKKNVNFNLTDVSPASQLYSGDRKWYNYSLEESGFIEFNIKIGEKNLTDYDTSFFNSTGSSSVIWGENMSYSVNFTYTDDGGLTWLPVTDPNAYCTFIIKDIETGTILYSIKMKKKGDNGNYTVSFNSSKLSAGISNKDYSIEITGSKSGYPRPEKEFFNLRINSVPTDMSVHTYETHQSVESRNFEAYFNEMINISIKYYTPSNNKALKGASVTYEWVGLDPILLGSDPTDSSYYILSLNTSEALSTGTKVISLTASLENYSQISIPIYLIIKGRRTYLIEEDTNKDNYENSDRLLYINKEIWVQDTHLFEFSYMDTFELEKIGNITTATYTWQKLYENGTLIDEESGSGSLSSSVDNSYILDFNTGMKKVGFYHIYITLKKDNYEAQSALLSLTIKLREMDLNLKATGLQNEQVKVKHGESVKFEVKLNDISRENIPLENATVYLQIGNDKYSFAENSPGIYTFTLDTENYDTFFTNEVLAGKLVVQKDNFTSQEHTFNIVVEMEEIFPGMPAFYFILIVSSIIGVSGSVVVYRVIQIARIPKFVKKIIKVRKTLKADNRTSEPIKTPSRNQMIVDEIGKDWEEIGYSLENMMGINKEQKSSHKKKIAEGGK